MREQEGVREAVVEVRGKVSVEGDGVGHGRLVGYVVWEEGERTEELRRLLGKRLPEYMVPGQIVCLEELPLTGNGKVDRRALPDPGGPAHAREFTPAAGAVEERLAQLWAEVLGLASVGVRDDFFELGGDSILALQIVARARQSGLRLTPPQMFEHRTVAELAAVVGSAPDVDAEQGRVTGDVPLTPIQRWFVEQELVHPERFNQALMLEVPEEADASVLDGAIRALVSHHDALRLRLARSDGGWRQWVEEEEAAEVFRYVDLDGTRETDRTAAIERVAEAAEGALDPERGPLVGVVLVGLGAGVSRRLLVVVHHLAVDAVSWQVLLEDLWKAYRQLRDGDDVAFGEKTTSFRSWAQRLETYAGSADLRGELAHWRRQAPARWEPLPVEVREGENLEGTVDRVTVELTREETDALLREVPATYRTRVDDVLLGALLGAFHAWTARSWLLVELEGHGREGLFEDVDLSRTVGWFTSQYPVLLEAERPDEPPSALREVKETLRAVPARGIGYGVLRYLGRDAQVAGALRDLPEPEVGFNYRGRFDGPRDEDGRFRAAAEPVGRTRSPEERRTHLLDVEIMVMEGRLQVTWLYSRNRHRRATVETIAASYAGWLRRLTERCGDEASAGLAPSDFPEADLTQEELDQLLEDLGTAT